MLLQRVRLCVFAGLLATGCSAADPGVDGLTRPGSKYDGGQSNVDGSVKLDSGSPSDSGNPPVDSGTDTSVATTAFTGAGAYASQQPATSAAMSHSNKGVGVVPNKDAACLTCHKNGGNGPVFLFAGTAFLDKAGTMVAADKEIRVRSKADGTAYIAHSDADGNFWFKLAIPANFYPASTGIRDGAKSSLMTGAITAGDCNGCHNGSGTDVTYLQ
jgi:cytochrome c553